MSAYIVPLIIVLLYASYKNLNTYNIFVKGAKGAIDLVVSIFPYIVAILVSVSLLRVSGLTNLLTKGVSPVFSFLGIPPEVSELVLLRPFTGSGSFALLSDIYSQYGADSYISRCASVIMGSSETVFMWLQFIFLKLRLKIAICNTLCASLL